MMKNHYQPIACAVYDSLTDLSVMKVDIEAQYLNAAGELTQAQFRIEDIITREKEEFLITNTGLEIRLDHLHFWKPIAEL